LKAGLKWCRRRWAFRRDNARPLGGWMPEFKSIWQSGQLLNEAVGQVGYRLFYCYRGPC
jgi:hypothetical protein